MNVPSRHASVVIAALLLPQALAALEVLPPSPTRCDLIELRVSRELASNCAWWAEASVTTISGRIEVLLELRQAVKFCLPFAIDLVFQVPIGRFEAGEYTVLASWSDLPGAPPLEARISVGEKECAAAFRRADANADGRMDLSDAVRILGHLFTGQSIGCREAADADGSGALNVSDPIYLLNFLFRGGPPPPAPFGQCAPPPGGLLLDCEVPHCD
jgi:hypothetical protein